MIYDSEAYKSVNYKKVYTKANELLVITSKISDFPFKAKPFVYELSDIKLCSYKNAIEKYSYDPRKFGSESAFIQEDFGAYIIFYNQDEPDYRVRFSIMHEFGHYILEHKMNLLSTDSLYHTQELEANCFAAQILMPEQLLRECSSRHKTLTIDYIMKSFGVSEEAADKRRKTLANTIYEWKSREETDYDDIIKIKYAEKLNQIAPMPEEFEYFNFEDDYGMQRERDSWLDQRSRWR